MDKFLKRIIFISFVIFFLFGSYLFRYPILSFILSNSLQFYTEKIFEGNFVHEGIKLTSNALVIKNPSMMSKKSFFQGEKVVWADQILIDYDLSILPFKINTSTKINGLKVDLNKVSELKKNQLKVSNFFIPILFFKLFEGSAALEVSHGQLLSPNLTLDLDSTLKMTPHINGSILLKSGNETIADVNITPKDGEETLLIVNIPNVSLITAYQILEPFFPSDFHLESNSGVINGSLVYKIPSKISFRNKYLLKPFDGELKLSNGELAINAHSSNITLDNIQGVAKQENENLKLDLHSNLNINNQTFSLNLDGLLDQSFSGKIAGVIKTELDFFQSEASFKRGKIATIKLEGENKDIHGKATVDWNHPKKLTNIVLNGNGNSVLKIAPKSLKKILQKFLLDKNLNINSNAQWGQNTLIFNGEIYDPQKAHDKIKFNLALGKDQKAKYSLTNGTFYLNNVDVENFISPVFFNHELLTLKGKGDVEGFFDPINLTIKYSAKNLVLENNAFRFEFDTAASLPNNSSPIVFPAIHHFNLGTEKHFGTISIQNGTFFEKNHGIVFKDIHGKANIDNEKVNISHFDSYINDIYMSGSIHIDYKDYLNGLVNIALNAPVISGKAIDYLKIISSINKNEKLEKIALEGNISSKKNGAHFTFNFQPQGCLVDGHIHGEYSDGKLLLPKLKSSLNYITSNFVYNHKDSTLNLTDIEAILLVGDNKNAKEFIMAGDHLNLSTKDFNPLKIDLWVNDNKRELIRIKGNVETTSPNLLSLNLNKEVSHLGDIYLDGFELTYNNNKEINKFHSSFLINLETLFSYLKKLPSIESPFYKKFVKKLHSIKNSNGKILANLSYENNSSYFNYDFESEAFTIDKNEIKDFKILGKIKDNLVSIDELKFNDFSLTGDFLISSKNWKINHFGVKIGKSLLMGLEGIIDPNKMEMSSKIKLLEIDLAHVDEWPKLRKVKSSLIPYGTYKASGHLTSTFDLNESRWIHNAKLNGFLTNWGFKGLALKTTPQFSSEYQSNKGLFIDDLKTSLYEFNDKMIDLGQIKGSYIFKDDSYNLIVNNFNAPSQNISWLDTKLRELSNTDDVLLNKLITSIQSQNNLEGSFVIEKSPSHHSLKINLNQNSYNFIKNPIYSFNEINIEQNPIDLLINAKGTKKNKSFDLRINTHPTLNSGEIKLIDSNKTDSPGSLTINWNNRDECLIQKIYGECFGIKANLIKNEISPKSFDGELKFNFNETNLITIKELSFETFKGVINDFNSWESEGFFKFDIQINNAVDIASPEKTQFNLKDPNLLVPKSGKVFFKIEKGKFLITKLKDTFSQNGMTKFQVLETRDSFIEMDGNLKLSFKLKPQNNLLKLFDQHGLFIEGPLDNPSVAIKKL